MKQPLKRLLCIIACAGLAGGTLPVLSVSAETSGGSCGTNLTWEYDDGTKTPHISGTGTMENMLMDIP